MTENKKNVCLPKRLIASRKLIVNLVKKVVFQIDALPVVKLISALFTHAFFVVFMLVVFAVMGFYPDLYVLQMFIIRFAW